MEQMDMSKYLPCTARLVGGTLYILDGEGRVQRRLDPLQTAIEWFQMSNDAFYALYGVNWVPKEPYYSQDGTFGRRQPCVRRPAGTVKGIHSRGRFGTAAVVRQKVRTSGRGQSKTKNAASGAVPRP